MDLLKYFDNIPHEERGLALHALGVPIRLVTAIMMEYIDVKASASIKYNLECEVFVFDQGANTGALEGPELGNALVDHCVGPVIDHWDEHGLGLELGTPVIQSAETRDVRVHHVWWADNLLCFACRAEMLQAMVDRATEASQSVRLEWKPDSLEVLYDEHIPENERTEIRVMSLDGVVQTFKAVDHMKAPGDNFDGRDGTERVLSHRIAAADRCDYLHEKCMALPLAPVGDRVGHLSERRLLRYCTVREPGT
ncbi:hypothetical protein N9L19_00405 [bacterium]|nr:hypothetical protein [bacterium]